MSKSNLAKKHLMATCIKQARIAFGLVLPSNLEFWTNTGRDAPLIVASKFVHPAQLHIFDDYAAIIQAIKNNKIPEDRLKCQESLGDLLDIWWSAKSPPMTCNSTFSLKITKGLTIEDALKTSPAEDGLVIPIPPIEMEARRRLLRIALCVIAYLNTSDPDVDTSYRDLHRPHFGMTPPNGMLLGGRFHLSPNWHLRKGHWRFLADEKFRREKDGSVRVIWVHEAEVNPEKRPGAAQERPYMIE